MTEITSIETYRKLERYRELSQNMLSIEKSCLAEKCNQRKWHNVNIVAIAVLLVKNMIIGCGLQPCQHKMAFMQVFYKGKPKIPKPKVNMFGVFTLLYFFCIRIDYFGCY